MSKPSRSRPEPTAHVDLEYPSSVPTFTVNPVNLSSSSTPLPWFSAFGRKDANAPLPSEVDPKYSDPAYYASSSTYGKNGRNTSHTAKKPEGHIKRPPNCFLLFRSHVKESGIRIPDALKPILKDRLREKRRETKAKKAGRRLSLENDDEEEEEDDDDDDNDEDEQSVSKISGILWDFLPAAEKSFFRARAAHAKAQHKKLYPNYKYSPQVKDKTVKRRVGKKMPTEKRERLEEVATVLVREMGWATGDEINVKRSATPSSVKPQHPALPQDQDPSANVPGTGAFGVSGYEHHNPYPSHKHAHHHHPQSASQYTASPFGDMGYPQPSMERRTSSCPPPGAHMTWADASATQTHTPPATSYGGMYPPPPPMPQPQAWAYPAPQAPYSIAPAPAPASTGYTVVRPGGKTARKMRTGPGSAKAQALNGKGASPASSSGGKKLPSKAATIDGGAMTLPSLHTALKTTNTEVPMSTGTGFDLHAQDAHWGQGYDHSQQSSPATFSSSAPPSVLLETPPFTNPQLQHYSVQQGTYDPASAAPIYDYSGQQGYPAQYDAYGQQPQQPYYAPYQPTPAVPAKEAEQSGELGLTIIDTNYTFPPPSESPRSGSPPKAPSQRERDRTKWARQHLHSPLGAVKQRTGATVQKPGRTSPTRRTPPPLMSPTPITPIPSHSLQNHPEQSLDDLGVDLDLSQHTGPRGEMDPGMLEFHFAPGSEMYGALDGYNVLGGNNGANLLLGDVALGMHDDGSQQQHSYTAQFVDAAGPESSLGPLDVPLDALYGGAEVVQEPFDPSSYITEDAGADLNAAAAVDELKMTSTQQLEYEMMEWRRGSGGERRASVQMGMALGSDVGVALYGFDAASTPSTATHSYDTNPAYGHGEFDFHNAEAVAPFTVPANYGMYSLQPQAGQQGLGTVMEERERASSEEADDAARKYHRSAAPGSWVASPA